MTSLNPSLRLALINKAKNKKNLLQKGFTLVELMVTVAIVGILSGVALPQFLAFQEDAKARSGFIEAIGLAKECATARKVGRLYPAAYDASIKSSGIASADCTSSTGTITYKSLVDGAEGMKCGTATVASTGNKKCQIVVGTDGAQTFSLIA